MTLIELILVMMILVTIAAVAAPRFSDSFPSMQVRKSADQVFAWARKARAEAALTGARQRLVFNPEKRKYWLAYEAKPLKEPGKFTTLDGAWSEEILPGEVVFESLEGAQEDPDSAEARYLEFRPDGTCTDATIVVANDRGDRKTIRVVGASSRVSIEAPKP